MLQRANNTPSPLIHPFVGKVENFWIFRNDYNPFEVDEVLWSTIVTILTTYWFLYVTALFLPPLYFIIDLWWILTFDLDSLKTAWDR